MEAVETVQGSEPGVIESLWAEGDGGEAGGGAEGGAGGEGGEEQLEELGESGEGGEGEGQGEGEGEGEGKPDGRRQPDAIRKHLASLKGKARGYEEVYPTVKEAREVKAFVESVGGREALQAAVQSHATMQRVDALLEAGDPAVLEEIFQQAPEGIAKLSGPILDRLAKDNPEAYESVILPRAVQMMAADGLPGAINAMIRAFNEDDKDSMKNVLGRVVAWWKGLGSAAKPGEAKADPKYTKLEEENRTLKETQQKEAIKATFDANLRYSADLIDKGLAADVKRLGLKPQAVERLRQDVWREIETRRNADQGFKAGIQTKFNGKMPAQDAVGYLNGFTDRALKEAIDQVVTTYYGPRGAAKTAKVDPTAAKKAAAGQAKSGGQQQTAKGAAAAWTRVAGPPAGKDIDFDHAETDTFAGRAVLKNGKRVNWR